MLARQYPKRRTTALSTVRIAPLQPSDLAIISEAMDNRYIIAATSDNTRKAYQADIRHYEITWGGSLPASTEDVLKYLHAFADILNPNTLARRLIALKQWHCLQKFVDPTVSPVIAKTLRGIRRTRGKPKEKAAPLLPEHLIKIVEYLATQNTLSSYRDSALLQLGFLGAFRRSELIAICMEDINWQPEGIEIQLKNSKTDQLNVGQYCVIPYGNEQLCAIRALKAWCEKANIESGTIFRRIRKSNQICEDAITPESVNIILKNHAKAVGIENYNDFSSHSMRRGLATTASRGGVSLPAIMRQGRWKQVSTVMEYIEAAQRFEENSAKQVLHKNL
ncbi:MAG: site-specific integrase [Gammaproteobacteria bacterium]|nr:site-specific integrase [Gammaproteobacteria bacterium]MCD8542944.1 site-specific integrase [Gammaproteobacteria bacterium]